MENNLNMRFYFEKYRAHAGNFTWIIFDKCAKLVTALFVGALVARYLGPSSYGQITLALSYIAFFQGIAGLGLDPVIIRDIVRNINHADLYLGTAFRLRILSALVAYPLSILSTFLFTHGDLSVTLLAALAGITIIFQPWEIIDLWFQSQRQAWRSSIPRSISLTIGSLLRLCFVFTHQTITYFASLTALDAILTGICFLLSYRNLPTTSPWSWEPRLASTMLREAFPLLISGVFILLYMRFGQIYLGSQQGVYSVGIYSVGASFAEALNIIPMSLVAAVAPSIALRRSIDRDSYDKIFTRLSLFLLIFSVTFAALNCLLFRHFIVYLYGSKFILSASVFSICSLALIPVSLGLLQSLWIINEKKTNISFYQSIAGGLTAVSLNLILVPKYGVFGAAVSVVASQYIQAFLVPFFIAPDLLKLQFSFGEALK
jgi:O-antigen/teichoic acid export membrane protein